MSRLHVQFYLAIRAALAVLMIASGLFWRFSGELHGAALGIGTVGELAQLADADRERIFEPFYRGRARRRRRLRAGRAWRQPDSP
jgi:hypothetical protein